MRQTIISLASDIIDVAAEIGATAEGAGDSIFAAETVVLLRHCQRTLKEAKDALLKSVSKDEKTPLDGA